MEKKNTIIRFFKRANNNSHSYLSSDYLFKTNQDLSEDEKKTENISFHSFKVMNKNCPEERSVYLQPIKNKSNNLDIRKKRIHKYTKNQKLINFNNIRLNFEGSNNKNPLEKLVRRKSINDYFKKRLPGDPLFGTPIQHFKKSQLILDKWFVNKRKKQNSNM